MAANAANVTTGKPNTAGAVYRAPAGTKLPVTANEKLDVAFEDMGYISEDGVKKAMSRESEEIKAWGGDTVANPQTGFSDKFTIKFLEAIRLAVLKAVYVDENVEGKLETGIHISVNSKEQPEAVWVIDTVLTGGVLGRMVIPNGKITEIGEVEYVDGSPVAYEATISAQPGTDGCTHHEYLVSPQETNSVTQASE